MEILIYIPIAIFCIAMWVVAGKISHGRGVAFRLNVYKFIQLMFLLFLLFVMYLWAE